MPTKHGPEEFAHKAEEDLDKFEDKVRSEHRRHTVASSGGSDLRKSLSGVSAHDRDESGVFNNLEGVFDDLEQKVPHEHNAPHSPRMHDPSITSGESSQYVPHATTTDFRTLESDAPPPISMKTGTLGRRARITNSKNPYLAGVSCSSKKYDTSNSSMNQASNKTNKEGLTKEKETRARKTSFSQDLKAEVDKFIKN
ncbi:hypothetical protein CC2G_003216 [Coprinopsis cinerea AmutBmut pab1-1]|nr:hypothetical protein CC2G_003216 [Coprinopsis cinerea AmutBmut pab1-1]